MSDNNGDQYPEKLLERYDMNEMNNKEGKCFIECFILPSFTNDVSIK